MLSRNSFAGGHRRQASIFVSPVGPSSLGLSKAEQGSEIWTVLLISGPPPVGLPLRQKAKGGAAALEGRLAGVEWGVLAALAA